MCGIAGFVGKVKNPYKVLNKMLAMLKHRGPDGSGAYVLEDLHLGLGHTRLAIVDLDRKADQPMWSLDQSIGVVFNGEI